MALWCMQRAGVEISVNLKSSAAEDFLAPLLRDLRAKPARSKRGICLVVSGEAGRWQLIDREHGIERTLKHDGDLVYHLTDRMVFHTANNAKAVHCIHAAAVSHAGGVLIVPAKSGAGKSTFTAWLVANGFDYLTDELILINEQFAVDGIGRPIQIKSNGIEAIKPLLVNHDYARGNMANAIPVSSLGGKLLDPLDEQNHLAAFVFPQFSREAEFEFGELSAAKAGLQLMNNHVNARNLEGHGFRAMMALVRAKPRYTLSYGGFDRLPRDFAEQLRALCTATVPPNQ